MNNPGDYLFATPLALLALLVFPVLWIVRRFRSQNVYVVPRAAAWQTGHRTYGSHLVLFLGSCGLIALIVALARPQRIDDRQQSQRRGYDIVIAVDLSGSMLTEDYERGGQPLNRIDALRPIINEFIQKRTDDRIGFVVFSGRAYTLSPLTSDHEWLARQIDRLEVGLLEDGTAVGDGLGAALTRLEQTARSDDGKRLGAFVILMTDGSNNAGLLTPQQSTEIAVARKIPVYTIGAGRPGMSRIPVFNEARQKVGYRRIQSDLDEATLKAIAKATGAEFFRALDNDTAKSAFAAIDRTQKIDFEAPATVIKAELFHWFAAPGAALLLLAGLLQFRRSTD